jgi:hypothetical protein
LPPRRLVIPLEVMRASTQNFIAATVCFALFFGTALRADQIQMQNGDRYAGKILSMNSNSIVVESDVLGKVTVPRDKVTTIMFGPASSATTNAAIPSIPVPRVSADGSPAFPGNSTNLAAAFHNLGSNTNFIEQVRQQMLAGADPAATQKYDELLNGLMSGQVSVNDLRNQAQTSIQQIKQLKQELGPQADESLDAYLSILQDFVNETAPTAQPAAPKPVAPRPVAPSAAFRTNSAPGIPNQ